MKGKKNQVKLLKKYSKFLILVYCHYIINIFNSLIDITDIHYLVLINLFNNFITNIFLKCVDKNLDLNNTKTILNEGCSIILDYIIISKEEKFNNNNYTPKFTDAIQFSYQKILYKIENNHLGNKFKSNDKKKNTNFKKRSNKQSLGNKTAIHQIINKQNQPQFQNGQNNNYTSLQNTLKFKNNLYKCIELLNCIFINIVKSIFIKKNNNLQLFIPLSNFIKIMNPDINQYHLYDDNKQNIDRYNNIDNIQYLNNNNIIDEDIIDENINNKNDKTTFFFNELSFNIDKIENYMLIMSNEIVLLVKDNKKINLYNIINIIRLGYQKINELLNIKQYHHLFYDIIYLTYPYLVIKNFNLGDFTLLQLNKIILNWCINNNKWLIYTFNSCQKNEFITHNVFKKINQQFLQSKIYI